MSGDVQPRKRKDKKRKKDEGESIAAPSPPIYVKESSEDVNIHVHKDEGTGGGICAKFVFFILFSALIILIGLIITEHRGLTDLDVPDDVESKYSQLFKGWVDDAKQGDHHNSNEQTIEEFENDEQTLDSLDEDDAHLHDENEEQSDEHFEDENDQSKMRSEENDDLDDQTTESKSGEIELKDISEEDEAESKDINFSEAEDNEESDAQNEDEDEDDKNLSEESKLESEETWENAELDGDDESKAEEHDEDESKLKDADEDEDKSQDDYKSREENEIDDVNLERETEEDIKFEETDEVDEISGTETIQQENENTDDTLIRSDENLKEEVLEEESELKTEEKTDEPVNYDTNSGNLSKESPSPDEESESEKFSDDNNDYEFSSITNKDDMKIREELDKAQDNIPNNAANALKMFEKILEKYPSSPRGYYGLAQALDVLAEIEKSNELLEKAILNYLKVIDFNDVPDALFRATLERCIDRIRFRGKYGKAVSVHLKLIERFPKDPNLRNQLAITYLTVGRIEQARSILEETLEKWPNNGCALAHYGFILKTTGNNMEKGVHFMQKGIDTKESCVIDGRFYFHLGDAYFRLGQKDKAMKIYEEGVKYKLFLSKYQRSLYNVPNLTGKPWWEIQQIPRYRILFEDLRKNWQIIKNEGLSVLNEQGYFLDESENLKDTGDWKQFELYARGIKNRKNCAKTPLTCQILEKHRDASGCRRGQSKFSVMHPGTHVWAHCGPTNCRLRIHLGLEIPRNTFIRVANVTKSWKEGNLLIFDDSFEHEVWHNGTEFRLVLIVDVWHPELTLSQRETLSPL